MTSLGRRRITEPSAVAPDPIFKIRIMIIRVVHRLFDVDSSIRRYRARFCTARRTLICCTNQLLTKRRLPEQLHVLTYSDHNPISVCDFDA